MRDLVQTRPRCARSEAGSGAIPSFYARGRRPSGGTRVGHRGGGPLEAVGRIGEWTRS